MLQSWLRGRYIAAERKLLTTRNLPGALEVDGVRLRCLKRLLLLLSALCDPWPDQDTASTLDTDSIGNPRRSYILINCKHATEKSLTQDKEG